MTQQRTDFPAFSGGYTRSFGDTPIMLDGMEVLFDRTVGLAPVSLVPKKTPAQPRETTRG
jgi:hypothetical protein